MHWTFKSIRKSNKFSEKIETINVVFVSATRIVRPLVTALKSKKILVRFSFQFNLYLQVTRTSSRSCWCNEEEHWSIVGSWRCSEQSDESCGWSGKFSQHLQSNDKAITSKILVEKCKGIVFFFNQKQNGRSSFDNYFYLIDQTNWSHLQLLSSAFETCVILAVCFPFDLDKYLHRWNCSRRDFNYHQ